MEVIEIQKKRRRRNYWTYYDFIKDQSQQAKTGKIPTIQFFVVFGMMSNGYSTLISQAGVRSSIPFNIAHFSNQQGKGIFGFKLVSLRNPSKLARFQAQITEFPVTWPERIL